MRAFLSLRILMLLCFFGVTLQGCGGGGGGSNSSTSSVNKFSASANVDAAKNPLLADLAKWSRNPCADGSTHSIQNDLADITITSTEASLPLVLHSASITFTPADSVSPPLPSIYSPIHQNLNNTSLSPGASVTIQLEVVTKQLKEYLISSMLCTTFNPIYSYNVTIAINAVEQGTGESRIISTGMTVRFADFVGPADNSVPIANAGTAQNVITGAVVTLDGSASSDANGDPLTYSWAVTSTPPGGNAYLSNTTIAKPTFNAYVAGTYVLSLVVNDGKVNSDAATVVINVRKPVEPIEIVYTVANGPTSDSLCYFNGNINIGGYSYYFNNCLMYGNTRSPLVAIIYNNTNTAYTINSLKINYADGLDDLYSVNETLSPNSSMRYDVIMHFYNELGQSEAIFDLTQIGAVSGNFTLTAQP